MSDDSWIDDFFDTGLLPEDVKDTICEYITQPDQVELYGSNVSLYRAFLSYMRLPIEKMTNPRIRALKENMDHFLRFASIMQDMDWL